MLWASCSRTFILSLISAFVLCEGVLPIPSVHDGLTNMPSNMPIPKYFTWPRYIVTQDFDNNQMNIKKTLKNVHNQDKKEWILFHTIAWKHNHIFIAVLLYLNTYCWNFLPYSSVSSHRNSLSYSKIFLSIIASTRESSWASLSPLSSRCFTATWFLPQGQHQGLGRLLKIKMTHTLKRFGKSYICDLWRSRAKWWSGRPC